MLNCGLGILLVPALGVLLLIKGQGICGMLEQVFAKLPGTPAVLVCAVLLLVSSMIDVDVPSVSLEGKNLWIPQSMPVSAQTALRAKLCMQLILGGIPMLFAAVCAALTVPGALKLKLLIGALPLVYTVFSALFGLFLGVRMPLLNWTSEIAPIKQGGAVAIFLFSGWGVGFAVGGAYLLIGYRLGAELYLLLWTAVFAVASLLLLRWLNTRGSRLFAELP